MRGIDDQVRQGDDRRGQLAFPPDAVGDRSILAQRVAVARFGEAADENLVVAIEIQHGEFQARHLAERRQHAGEQVRIEAPRAKVDADGERLVPGGANAGRIDQATDQAERQVVDDLVAEVLKRLQRRRLAGTGHAGDQQDAEHFGRRGIGGHRGARL